MSSEKVQDAVGGSGHKPPREKESHSLKHKLENVKNSVGRRRAFDECRVVPCFALGLSCCRDSAPAQGQQQHLKQTSDVASLLRLCCRTSVSHSGKGTSDVASRAPRDGGRSCRCRPFDVS